MWRRYASVIIQLEHQLTSTRLRGPAKVRLKARPQRHDPQQQLRRHRIVQHLRRYLRRHHLRCRLLLRSLLARATRVERRHQRLESLLSLCLHAYALRRPCIHLHHREQECAPYRHGLRARTGPVVAVQEGR